MRLPKELIRQIAEAIAASLDSKGLVKPSGSRTILAERIAEIITQDMLAEDRLNREVEKLLEAHEDEIAKGGMDYRKVFELTKQKLARERKIVL